MRRMWMLLLVLVLTVVIMAVPAMAAEHGDHTTGDWEALPAGALSISEGDHYYYLADDTSTALTVTGGNVTICLNGKTWSGTTARPLTVKGGTVTIEDCGDLLEDSRYISQGKIVGVDLYNSVKTTSSEEANRGGTIYVAGAATVNFHNGTITGGSAVQGGNIYIVGTSTTGKAVFNMIGGQIKGISYSSVVGKAIANSAISGLDDPSTRTDGGVAYHRGGQVFIANYADFNFGVEGDYNGTEYPIATGGVTLYKQGGGFSVDGKGTLTIWSGTISGASSLDSGGNFHLAGSDNTGANTAILNMHGGLITGGHRLKNSSSKVADKTDIGSGQNGFVNGGCINMTGGQIDGSVTVYNYNKTADNRSDINISGSAKILGKGVYLNNTPTGNYYHGVPLINFGELDKDAEGNYLSEVRVYFADAAFADYNDNKFESSSWRFVDTSTQLSFQELVDEGIVVAQNPTYNLLTAKEDGVYMLPMNLRVKTRVTTSGKVDYYSNEDWYAYEQNLPQMAETLGVAGWNGQLSFESGGIWVRPVSEVWHCVCSGDQSHNFVDGKISHIGTCDKYDHKWTAYEIKSDTAVALPTASGYFYLVDKDSNPSDNIVHNHGLKTTTGYTGAQTAFNGGVSTYIDMHGVEVKTSRRWLSFNSKTAGHEVVFTNSMNRGGITFLLRVADNDVGYKLATDAGGEYSGDHSYLWLQNVAGSTAEVNAAKKLTFYRLTIDGREMRMNSNLINAAAGTLYMYNTTVYGAAMRNGNGSAVAATVAGNLVMDGCTIVGKSASANGAAVNITTTESVTITGSNITGGTATENGGAIYQNNGTVEMINTTITGGNAKYGGAISSTTGSLSMTGCTVDGGHATENGGAIYNANGLTLVNCIIKNGDAKYGGNMYTTGSTVATITGGSFQDGDATGRGGNMQTLGNVTMERVTISGGESGNGGNIYIWNGNLTLKGCTVSNGAATNYGGNICTNSGDYTPNLTIQDSVIEDSTVHTTVSGGSAVNGGNIYLDTEGTHSITNAVIRDGIAKHTVDKDYGRGANIHVGSALTLTGCTISGGVIEHTTGAISATDEKAENYGATGIFVTCSTLSKNSETGAYDDSGKHVVIDNCKIYGNPNTQVVDGKSLEYHCDRGGTVYAQGNSHLTIKGNTLITASAAKYGAAMHIANAMVFFEDNATVDASYYYIENEAGEFVKSEQAVSAYDGTAIHFNNGAYYVQMGDNTHIIGGNAEHEGGAVSMKGAADLTLLDSAMITGGTARWGGAVHLNDTATLTMSGEGCEISGGKSTGNGGAVYVGNSATFNMSAGTISGGQTTGDQGGNIHCGGAMSLTGGTIEDGTSGKGGGNISINSTRPITFGAVTIQDGTAGGAGGNIIFNMTNGSDDITFNGTTITGGNAGSSGGNVQISNNNLGEFNSNTTHYIVVKMTGVTISGGTAKDAENNISVYCTANATKKDEETGETITGTTDYKITLNIYADDLEDEIVTHSVIGGYPAATGDEESVVININGVAQVNNYDSVHASLATATADIAETGLVTMLDDAEDQTVSNTCFLDLDGHKLTNLTVTGDAKISLFDSKAINYVASVGYVTLADGQSNPFNRQILTGDVIDRNLRFVTIAETDAEGKVTQYSAHRIYLAVKSTVLYPKTTSEKVALGYRIALRCDGVLASYLSAYGLKVTGDLEPVYVPTKSGATGNGATNDNSKVIGVSYETNTDDGEKTLTGSAYLTINDGFGSDNTLTSGAVETSLKKEVESAFTKYNTLNETLKANLDWMVETYSTVMSGWATTPPAVNEEN